MVLMCASIGGFAAGLALSPASEFRSEEAILLVVGLFNVAWGAYGAVCIWRGRP